MTWRRWLSFAGVSLAAALSARPAVAQLAPTGGHYADRASDTGFTGGVTASGGYGASVPLDLPSARGGLPVPVSIVYGERGVGAAGLGWDVPLSYIRRDLTVAHRRPLENSGAAPQAHERVTLVLGGQSHDLVKTDSGWVARRNAPDIIVREKADGTWVMYDGQGRTYTFTTVSSALAGANLWLLKSIAGVGGSSVQLDYNITTPTIPGGTGLSIDLTTVSYNPHPTTVSCFKNSVALHYDTPAASPLSLSMLGDRVLVRMAKVDAVNINSKATCGDSYVRLRHYELTYQADADTQRPRLQAVKLFGRDGTPEAATAIPVAAYSYGTATNGGKLQYQRSTDSFAPGFTFPNTDLSALPAHVPNRDTNIGFSTFVNLLDVTGDGLPDVLTSTASNSLLVFSNWLSSATSQTLTDTAMTHGPLEIRSLNVPRYSFPANTDLVWRQAIDVNGDGRVDFIDASEEAGHWVVYLNIPDLSQPSTARWSRRTFSTATLEAELAARNLPFDPGAIPLARHSTLSEVVTEHCWTWNRLTCDWNPSHACGTSTNQMTFTEWELNDINGDGYPDVVMNSSPVAMVPSGGGGPPDDPPACNTPATGHTTSRVTPRLAATNEIDAVLNVLGVHVALDSQPFSAPVLLRGNDTCGVAKWTETDSTHQSLLCSILDVNGDNVADRVDGRSVRLGTGAFGFGASGMFMSGAQLTLPGSVAIHQSDEFPVCAHGAVGSTHFSTHLTAGLRDLTGDGIPDYVAQDSSSHWSVAIGTGTGFLPSIPIDGAFALSLQEETCNGTLSSTTSGLYDVDGDGKPDVVTANPANGAAFVHKLVGSGGVFGTPEAGRLVQMDNGFGAVTSITYRSAKLLIDQDPSGRAATSIHQVPFPEVVVSSVETLKTQSPSTTLLAKTRYAYGGAQLLFDAASDAFYFPGYRRQVALRVPTEQSDGLATITDTYVPDSPFDPFAGTSTSDQRFALVLRHGRVSDVTVLSGNLGTDPSPLLAVNVASDARRIANTHYEYDAKLLSPATGTEACNEMIYPYAYALSLSVSMLDACRQRGFAFASSVQSFRGEPGAAAGSDATVTTRSEVLTIDDLGRPTSVKQLGDAALSRADDDVCIDTEYAKPDPNGQNERVLWAVSARKVTDCGKTIYAKDTWEYDNREHLATPNVSAGLLTSHIVERLGDGGRDDTASPREVREFDASFTPEGNPDSITTRREDGATRTASVTYDVFGLVPVNIRTAASGLLEMSTELTRDPLTLNVTSTKDPNLTKFGMTFDGFDRPVISTVLPPGGTEGALSCTIYQGFAGGDSQGRRVTSKVFTDAVPAATACAANGRTATVYLDELGRPRLTEQVLGADYPNVTMKVDRTYDSLGRLLFATDPYPSTQDAATAYGTTRYFNADGTPSCFIRGKGKQPQPSVIPIATNETNEVYPTCFARSFLGGVELVSVRDAASLLANSPQNGVMKFSALTATGRLIARATWQNGTRLEYASFTQDRLGHLASMTRYENAPAGTNPVKFSWHTNSLGQVVELDEPDSPAQLSVYSDWGELIETNRTAKGIVKRTLQKYDALRRLIHSEQQSGGVVDPETVHDFAYDTAVQVAPEVTAKNVLGRLAQATWPTGSVTFSYDGLGRNNAQVFTNLQGGKYSEKLTFHGDGSLDSLELFLPDTGFADEKVKYTHDSAGRGKTVTYSNGADQRELYNATTIDPFGRVRAAKYALADYTADYDDLGRRLMKQVAVSSPAGSRKISYGGFDPVGRERSRTEIQNNTGGGPRTDWTYDALGRLSSAVQTGGTSNFNQQFSYDPLGNLRKLTSAGTSGTTETTLSYSTTDLDRIFCVTFGTNSGTSCDVTYDELGSIASQPTPTGSRTYTYLVDGSVRTITDNQGSRATFRYDAFGQVQELDFDPASSALTDERSDRHYGALFTLRNERANGGSAPVSVMTRKIPLHDGSFATRHGPSGPWTFEYGEQRGNRFFTDQAGAFVQNVDYEPFGKPTSTGAQPGSELYSSTQWNFGDSLAAFGVSQLGARLYDPAIGRFISRDPLLIPRTAATTNPYAFASNDPVNGSDPSGMLEGGRPDINDLRPVQKCQGSRRGGDGCPGGDPEHVPSPVGPPITTTELPPPSPESPPSLPQGIPTPMPTAHSGDATLFGGGGAPSGAAVATGSWWSALTGGAGWTRAIGLLADAFSLSPLVMIAYVQIDTADANTGYNIACAEDPYFCWISADPRIGGGTWAWAMDLKAAGDSNSPSTTGGAAPSSPAATPPVDGGDPQNDPTKNRVKLRKKTREQIELSQPRNDAGEMIDPNTRKVLKSGETDVGHKPGQEWRIRRQMHQVNGSTRSDVRDTENNPDLYHLEDRSSNRSHQYEKK